MAEIDGFTQARRIADELAAMDKEIATWAKLTVGKLRQRLATLSVGERIRLITKNDPKLSRSLKGKLGKKNGEIERVSIGLARHGIFLQNGVGKGRPVDSAAARLASKDWIAFVLDPQADILAELLAEKYADIAAAEVAINIPDVMTTKIKN